MDHSVLVSEDRDIGVHEVLIRWIGAFLTARSQQVKIGSVLSNCIIPRGGIPQGTRLAPLLFAVLVNNLVRTGKLELNMWTICQSYRLFLDVQPACCPL